MGTKKYKIIGVVVFVSQAEYNKYGHLQEIGNYPVFEYERVDEDAAEDIQYWCLSELSVDKKYIVMYDYMVKKRYSIDDAKEIFPEMFL